MKSMATFYYEQKAAISLHVFLNNHNLTSFWYDNVRGLDPDLPFSNTDKIKTKQTKTAEFLTS